ncbi:hypothetical protein GXW74_06400 [Roseomonas eburnea]|uniref:Uncharacterized protein n=1 Tax=Neoroseomonas eburnea TaxID=1346889 RepID=A0A9X9X8S4_9PROT|nr:hypothetical protein [Neoroseomonas eburnea]MBR0680110.1 hypothetical protein [Neoroseomonas eburnea]
MPGHLDTLPSRAVGSGAAVKHVMMPAAALACAGPPAIAESARSMHSARDRAAGAAPGPWQGNRALLRISADPGDPFLLGPKRGAKGRASARPASEKGGLAHRLDAERE